MPHHMTNPWKLLPHAPIKRTMMKTLVFAANEKKPILNHPFAILSYIYLYPPSPYGFKFALHVSV